jgi:hypothetical protein
MLVVAMHNINDPATHGLCVGVGHSSGLAKQRKLLQPLLMGHWPHLVEVTLYQVYSYM